MYSQRRDEINEEKAGVYTLGIDVSEDLVTVSQEPTNPNLVQVGKESENFVRYYF